MIGYSKSHSQVSGSKSEQPPIVGRLECVPTRIQVIAWCFATNKIIAYFHLVGWMKALLRWRTKGEIHVIVHEKSNRYTLVPLIYIGFAKGSSKFRKRKHTRSVRKVQKILSDLESASKITKIHFCFLTWFKRVEDGFWNMIFNDPLVSREGKLLMNCVFRWRSVYVCIHPSSAEYAKQTFSPLNVYIYIYSFSYLGRLRMLLQQRYFFALCVALQYYLSCSTAAGPIIRCFVSTDAVYR